MTRKLKTFHDKAENKRTGPEWTGYRTGPDKSGQDRTGHDKSGRNLMGGDLSNYWKAIIT